MNFKLHAEVCIDNCGQWLEILESRWANSVSGSQAANKGVKIIAISAPLVGVEDPSPCVQV